MSSHCIAVRKHLNDSTGKRTLDHSTAMRNADAFPGKQTCHNQETDAVVLNCRTLLHRDTNQHSWISQLLHEGSPGAAVTCKSSDISRTIKKDPTRVVAIKEATLEAVKNSVVPVVERLLPLVKEIVLPVDDRSAGLSFMDALMATAVKHGHSVLVERLIQHGANPSSAYQNKPHLIRAVLQDRGEVTEALLKHGVDVTATESNGKTALHVAAYCSDRDIILALMEHGSDIEARDKVQENTPMHVACTFCNREAIITLFNKGAEFNAANHQGDTPLSKLLRLVTKADDFHNRTRIALAKELILLGFVLQPKKSQMLIRSGRSQTPRYGKSKGSRNNENSKNFDPITNAAAVSSIQKTTKEDRLHNLYAKLCSSLPRTLSLQQQCRLTILRSLGTRPLQSCVKQLGLPLLAQGYLRTGDGTL